jgi:DNA-binding GntR family transcriptional regulator
MASKNGASEVLAGLFCLAWDASKFRPKAGTARMLNLQQTKLRSDEKPGELSRDEIVRVLEQEIMTAQLKPRERLDERVLAARFGVSRAPVRDAIGRLASLGLVDVRPRSGSYVASLNVSEVIELLELLSGLEGLCAYHAAQRADAVERDELKRLADLCDRAASASTEEYIGANNLFHEQIYMSAKNRQLAGLARQARRRIDAYRHLALRVPGRLREAAQEHIGIVDAVSTGDAPSAQRLMVSHADIQKNDFAQYISIIEAAESRL